MKIFTVTLLTFILSLTAFSQTGCKILLSNTTKHIFSNAKSPDDFLVRVTGKSVFSGKVVFEILTADKRVIHHETFDAAVWCEYIDDFTTKQKEDVIRKKIKEFFLPLSFKSPAIWSIDKYDEDYYDKSLYSELKADKSSTGFYYQNAMEGQSAIAWSKKKRKVVNYYAID